MMSIVEFLKTGELDGIRVGMAPDQVRDVLGEPFDTSLSKKPWIWKYDPIEITFSFPEERREFRVESISISFRAPDAASPAPLRFSDWDNSRSSSFQDFKGYLDKHAIRAVGGGKTGPDQTLVLESSVRATFHEGTLYSIRYDAKNESQVKQITFSIPRDDFEAVRGEAAELGVSVSVLCSRWIRERVVSLQPHS
jgi:hypothetical protein